MTSPWLIARKSVLDENGFQATIVTRPDEVLALIEKELFHLVVTDYKMPLMTGIELIQQIRAAGHKQPIILVSGYVDALGLNETNTGANMVIQKGAHEVPQLLHCVKALLLRKMRYKVETEPRKMPASSSIA